MINKITSSVKRFWPESLMKIKNKQFLEDLNFVLSAKSIAYEISILLSTEMSQSINIQ